MTGEDLYNLNIEKIPCVVEPIFQKTGVAALVGSSDTGKSTILRQLAIAIVTGKKKFLDEFEINAEHNSVIYISTEDDAIATAVSLKKQAQAHIKNASELKDLRFIFNDTDNYLKALENELQKQPADCVIVDAFTDVFPGELNASTKVRAQINEYDKLASKYKTLIIFLHHTGKRTDQFTPTKDNILGSQGFEAKMRCVVELRADPSADDIRHLCIVKGNYISNGAKSKSYVLKFLDDLNFKYTGHRTPFEALRKGRDDPRKMEAKRLAIKLKGEGQSISNITDHLVAAGYLYSRSTIGNWVK